MSGENGWIEVDMPWQVDEYKFVDLDPNETKKVFGKTYAEAKLSGEEISLLYREILSDKRVTSLTGEDYKSLCIHIATEKGLLEIITRRDLENDIINYWSKHPAMIQHREAVKKSSFCGSGLNVPGTLIEVDGSEYLIGHVNTEGGVCNDCMEFSSSAIVKKYKVVWRPA